MLEIGVQSRNIVEDPCPEKGFRMLKDAGFSCTDFSLNSYLTNKDLYEGKVNAFFSQSNMLLYIILLKALIIERKIRYHD